MSLHKKIHRLLLIIGFIYLMVCPSPRLHIPDLCKFLVASLITQTYDGKLQRLQAERLDGKSYDCDLQHHVLPLLTFHGERNSFGFFLHSGSFSLASILSTTHLLL